MKELQEKIIQASMSKIEGFTIKKVIISTVVYVAFILIVFLIAQIEMNYLHYILVTVISFLYCFFREKMVSRRVLRIVDFQYQFLKAKHPSMSLYIPLFSATAETITFKKSALMIDKNKLYLEAFQTSRVSMKPTNSISLIHGDQFILTDHQKYKKDLHLFIGTLLQKDYQLAIADIEEVVSLISKYIKFEKKEV